MKILSKKILVAGEGIARIVRLQIQAPDIAAKVKPGQFVVVMPSLLGERIPLTVVDSGREGIVLIFQEVGLTTKLLGKMEAGDALFTLAGPFGHPTEIKNYGKVILLGGGVGIAEIYPVAKALKKEGNKVTVILGARSKALLLLEDELKGQSEELFVTTDDGSCGKKGVVTGTLKELLEKQRYDLAYAVGPIPMMRNVSLAAREFGLKTIVSLNALMVDATGMCGCCRVTVGGRTRFSCIDGPEFEGELVDWEELAKRNCIYREQEEHICNLYKLA